MDSSEEPKIRLELRDNKQACVCLGCGAWYHLESPSVFKHNKRCQHKKTNTNPINESFTSWQYNVIDEYKSLSQQEIKEKIIAKQLPFAVMMENWQGDFNLATVIRNANAMGAQKVFYLGAQKGYDRRGTTGTHHYTDVVFLPNIEELKALKSEYKTFIGVEQVENSINLPNFQWPTEKFLILLGEEGCGLTQNAIKLCDQFVEIKQIGSVRSLNAGVASGIVMYDILSKIG
jgi:tRNA G18 (ribose-2'-O)-methylase SpoU